jgi:hypothetical protein
MSEQPEGILWLASYPKSGNTWLRSLLEAYRRNGVIDLNDIRVASGDMGASLISAVSPSTPKQLGLGGELLLRPCALLNLMARLRAPYYVKTHFANLHLPELPPFIPKQLTKSAIYIVRDPRSVFLSFQRYFGSTLEMTADAMASKEFHIEATNTHASQFISSWSNHVSSWTGEKDFPVHVVKYEDMLDNPDKELREILEVMEWEIDEDRIQKAVEVCTMEKFQKFEADTDFKENSGTKQGYKGRFFNGGGSRWKDELGPRWIKRIEDDHREVMTLLGYLDKEPSELTAVS